MATSTPDVRDTLEGGYGRVLRRIKDVLFEGLLVAATLVGILALFVLFALIGSDALGLSRAEPSWYLVYLGTLVAPTGLYTLYVRSRPAVASVNALAFGVTFGGLALSLCTFVVADALEPLDVAAYFLGVVGPPAVVLGHARLRGETSLTGPAVPLSILVGVLGVTGVGGPLGSRLDGLFGALTDPVIYAVFVGGPLLAILGYARRYSSPGPDEVSLLSVPVRLVGLGALWIPIGVAVVVGVYDPLTAVLDPLSDWLLFAIFTTGPAAGLLGVTATRRWNRRYGLATAGVVVGLAVLATQVGPIVNFGPELSLVLASGFLAPVGVVAADTVDNRSEGRVGLLGPAVVVGGILLGAVIESQYAVVGPDTWLRPVFLTESWSGFRPEQAGIYPPLVGSLIIVSLMTALSFPVGVGAALYLEEYAPDTGLWGRLTTALDINISNLAGVPSVVYGLLGLALFQQALGLYPGLVVAGSVTLGLLILPIVIVASQEALRSVPDEFRQAASGLGASRWQTTRRVVLPEAFPGILTGTILAIGRAIGETAPLVMLSFATTTFSAPNGLLDDGTALPLQIFAAKANDIPEYRTGVVAAAAIVLLVLMLVLNATAILLRNRYQRDEQQ